MFFSRNYDRIPLEGIKVSDGRNVVITDASGEYELPGWERANIISVQVLTKSHDDWYRYIDSEHNVYDFYISPYEGSDNTSFLHFSDTEITIDGFDADGWIDFVKDCVKNEKPDFIIQTGDICRRRGLELHHRVMNSENMGIPVRYTLGNHDYVADKYGEYTYERLYGPVWYSFDLGNIHYVALPITKGEVEGLYKPTDCVRWLKNDLNHIKPSQRLSVLCHTYCEKSVTEFVLSCESGDIDLKKHGLLLWVFGHLHICNIEKCGDAFYIGTGRPDCGGTDGTPAACRVINISEKFNVESHLIFNKRKTIGHPITSGAALSDGGIVVCDFDGGVNFINL